MVSTPFWVILILALLDTAIGVYFRDSIIVVSVAIGALISLFLEVWNSPAQ